MQPPSLDQCRAMLACIGADDRETWVRMGMALHSEFDGADGFAVFDTWSQTAEKYDPKHARVVWKGFKPGPVKIGTLIDEAKRRGYTLETGAAQVPQESPEDIARRTAEREQRAKAGKAATDKRHEQAAKTAQTALHDASDTGTSEYLARKGCGAYGLKYERDGALLVPMRDATGALRNVQRIFPTKQPDGTDKRFLPGGLKSGLWHWVGSPSPDSAYNGPLLIAEGYATAASLHEACAMPCAVAFDCGNLIHVAKAIRGLYPHAVIVLCADDDANNTAKHADGRNPGVEKSRTAAKAVRGRVAVPLGLPDGSTDFNDLMQHAGAAAVKACIDAALVPDTPAKAANATPTVAYAGATDDRFTVTDEGVFVEMYDPQAKRTYPLRVCPPLWVRARTRNSDGGEWGYQLEFCDPKGKRKTWVLPSRMLAGDGTEYRSQLAGLGFESPQNMRERKLLTEYILTRPQDIFARTVKRIGWHDDRGAFVLPGEVIQHEDSESVYLQSDGEPDTSFRSKGTLDAWRTSVAALAVGNSRLMFAMSCAFAGPLLEPSQQAGGGYHLRGDSTEGKTTALRMAASVWGAPAFVQTWRATDSALEWVCASRCDTFLPLDELKEIEATKIGACAYMLANGMGKGRSNQGAANRPRHEWRVLFLSTGEISVQDHIREGNGKVHAGQEVRVPDIPSNAGAGLGIFEALHNDADGAAFAKRLGNETRENYGHAGPAFVRWLFERADQLSDGIREKVKRAGEALAPPGASQQVMRVVDRFALVAVAGELATKAGLTGWSKGDATEAARTCLNSWVDSRGGLENREEMEVVTHARRMIALHGRGRYNAWERSHDSKAPNVPNALGWRRKLSLAGGVVEMEDENATGNDGREVEYVHDRKVFQQEFCNGKDLKFVLSILKARGYLKCNAGRNTLTVRLPGFEKDKYAQCIVVKSSILSDE